MINILLLTILISFVTMGARIITQPEYFGWSIRFYAIRWAGCNTNGWKHYAIKPIITCCVCMPSLWGICMHLSILGISTPELYYMPLELISASFLNAFFWKKYNIDKKLKKQIHQLKTELTAKKSELTRLQIACEKHIKEFKII